MSPGKDDHDSPDRHRRPHHLPQPLPLPYALTRSDQLKLLAKKYRTEVAASAASLASTYLTFPLDTVKTKLQTYRSFSGIREVVKHTYNEETARGFWRGVWSPLMSITIVRTVSLSIYQQAKYFFDEQIYKATGTSPLVIANTRGTYPNFYTIGCFGASGMVAGAGITAIACPFELVKVAQQLALLMSKSPNKNMDVKMALSYKGKGTFGTAKQIIINTQSRFGVYSGVRYHLLRDTLGTGVYFMTYESVKQLLANSRGDSPTSPAAVVVAGGACGIVSWCCIFPIDTAKQKYQMNCLSQQPHKTEKVPIEWFTKDMYRGLGISITRSALVNAIFFSTFELAKKRINALEVEEES